MGNRRSNGLSFYARWRWHSARQGYLSPEPRNICRDCRSFYDVGRTTSWTTQRLCWLCCTEKMTQSPLLSVQRLFFSLISMYMQDLHAWYLFTEVRAQHGADTGLLHCHCFFSRSLNFVNFAERIFLIALSDHFRRYM